MKVQRVQFPDRVTWLVLDDDYVPIQPILTYLKFLDDLGRSQHVALLPSCAQTPGRF
jgi:integrase/recombinase XerD